MSRDLNPPPPYPQGFLMSPGSKIVDDELEELLRSMKRKQIQSLETDPIYLAAIDWRDVSRKKLDKALVDYGH